MHLHERLGITFQELGARLDAITKSPPTRKVAKRKVAKRKVAARRKK